MIVFNTTYHIEDNMHDEVIEYFKKQFIPKAIETKQLRDPHLFFIHAQHEENGKSYSLQFRAKSLEDLEKWMQEIGASLQSELSDRFGQRVCGFMTLLEETKI